MTTRALLHRWTRRIATTAVLCAVATAIGAGAAVRVVAEWLGGSASQARALALVVGGLAVVADLGRRLRGRLTPVRVALWLEERVPELRYALVASTGDGAASVWCEARVRRFDVGPAGWRALGRALRVPALVLMGGVAMLRWAPREAPVPRPVRDVLAPRPVGAPAFAALTARVAPPWYTRAPAQVIDDPIDLHPLPGSTVTLAWPGDSVHDAGPRARLDDGVARVSYEGGAWVMGFRTDTATHVVRLSQGTASRLITVEPRRDSLPSVTLETPATDTILRRASGVVRLRGRASDDLGLVSASFEYIVSSGEGERFTFRTGTVGTVQPARASTAVLTGALDLGALSLAAGDVVHLRAVARDANDVTGPGVGSSDTRTIRIARAGEYDSVAVEAAAPPEADKSLLSQRMLINLTEALLRRAPALGRDAVMGESRRIGRDQARLRRQVSDFVFARLGDQPLGEHFHGDGHNHGDNEPMRAALTPEELLRAAERATGALGDVADAAHDESPVVAINRPLLEAYNAMWDAGRALEAGEPARALPPMYVALAAIQSARAAERLYLRGVPPRVVVDVGRARLQGRDRGVDAVHPGIPAAVPIRRAALERLQRALARSDPSAVVESLLVVRVAVGGRVPGVADALTALVADVRAGRPPAAAAARVRRLLDPSSGSPAAPTPWSGWR